LFFAVKLVLIQVFNSEYLSSRADEQHSHVITLEPKRGTIYDRRMRPFAVNVPAYSLYASPRTMTASQKETVLRELPKIVSVSMEFLKNKLSRDKSFIWLLRKLSPEEMTKVKSQNLKGLNFLKESKRNYPNQSMAAQIIGFAGTENEGLEGIELKYNDFLHGHSGSARMLRDARQKDLLIEESFLLPQHGFDLILTIDQTIQYIAERAMDKAFNKNNAKGATLVLINPKTGEILAMVNRPTYDLSQISSSQSDSRRNRAVSDMYEPGSVFKIVTASAALEEEIVFEDDKFFCENGEYRVANHILHDHTSHGTLTFREVIEQSSNIGVVKIAQLLGGDLVNKYAQRYRFGRKTDIDLPGEVSGVLKPVSRWSKTSIGAVPIGHEVGVSTLQLACAVAAIANKGIYMKPFIVKYITDQKGEIIEEFHPKPVAQVISEKTARRLTDILVGVVENGTGKRARIKNIKVAGKTGTAQKIVNNVYSHNKFYATFIGFAPADDPVIAMAIMFDEPHPNHYGGTVSAPVFQEVAENVLKYLNAETATSLKKE